MNENRLREIIKEEIAENSDVVYKGIVEIQENLAKKIKILDKFNVN